MYTKILAATAVLATTAHGHGYLSKPMSRTGLNAEVRTPTPRQHLDL